jgi:hypothetical protein
MELKLRGVQFIEAEAFTGNITSYTALGFMRCDKDYTRRILALESLQSTFDFVLVGLINCMYSHNPTYGTRIDP